VLWFDENWMHYTTDTQPGSSGSPVFNDQWLVVALHHSGVPKTDKNGKVSRKNGEVEWIANEGVRISCIYKALEEVEPEDTHAAKAISMLRASVPTPALGPILSPQTPRALTARSIAGMIEVEE
jgi:endonuclease G